MDFSIEKFSDLSSLYSEMRTCGTAQSNSQWWCGTSLRMSCIWSRPVPEAVEPYRMLSLGARGSRQVYALPVGHYYLGWQIGFMSHCSFIYWQQVPGGRGTLEIQPRFPGNATTDYWYLPWAEGKRAQSLLGSCYLQHCVCVMASHSGNLYFLAQRRVANWVLTVSYVYLWCTRLPSP